MNYLCGHCLQWIEWVQRQSITHKLLGHLLTSLLSIFSQIKIMLNKTWNIALTWLYWSLPDGWCFAHVRMLQLIFLKYILKFIHKLQRHFYYPNIRILLPTHRLFIIFEGKLWTHSILIKRSLSCRVVNRTSRNCTVPGRGNYQGLHLVENLSRHYANQAFNHIKWM